MRYGIVAALLVIATSTANSQSGVSTASVIPKSGFVPDASTAIKIGEAVLIPVYGERIIRSERPFKATLKGAVWIVEGTLHCDASPVCPGGVAIVKIAKSSGRILHMVHYQ